MVHRSGWWHGVLSLAVSCACAACNRAEQVGETSNAVELAASSYTLTLETPRDVSIAAVALGAEHSLELEQRSKVIAHAGNGVAIVSNMGEAGTTLRHDAHAETLYSKSKVTLESGAHLANDLFAPEAIMSADAVRGTVNVPFDVGPANEIVVNVEFPQGPGANVRVSRHRKRELLPGRYATLEISGTLRLSSGTYYFESLDVTDTGVVDLKQQSGPTMIFVRNQTKFFGRVRHEHAQELGIVQIGSAAASIAGQYEGAFVAPNASVELGARRPSHAGNGSDHSDGFWGWWGTWSGRHGSKAGSHDGDGHGNSARDNDDHDGNGHDEHDSLKGTFYGKSVRLLEGERVVFKRSKVLGPLLYPDNPQACVDLITPPTSKAGGAKHELAYQRDIARYCSMLGSDECTIQLTSRVNIDYTALAVGLMGERLTPAQYLQAVRDRTRKLRAAEDDPAIAAALCAGRDADGDFIPNARDHCNDTPDLTATDDEGCTDTELPEAPSAEDMKRVFENSGFMFNAACSGAAVLPKPPAGAFYRPPQPEAGTFIFSGRVMNQPTSCPVWYFFDIQELNGAGALIQSYVVAFMDREESTALVGTSNPVPGGFIQFNPLPGDAGTRGLLGNVGGKANVRFRVRAMNGGGSRGDWSEWKETTNADCLALGFSCE